MRPNSLQARDVASLVHQQTDLERFQQEGGLIFARGEGIRVFDTEGKEYIEGMAGLWSCSLGYSEKRLADAAYKQMTTLPYYHTFYGRGHAPAIELAEKLLSIAPKGMARVLFQCSGSEANDAAIKIIWQYHNIIGKPQKKKIIGRVRGYHGNTVAAVSVSGQPHMHLDFDVPLPGFLHTDMPHYYRAAQEGESEEAFSARMAANLEALIEREGPDTIAAFFAEPVQGGGGALTPPRGYFEAIQPILKKHDILFLADEVICGFGRTGNMWGSQTYGLEPDLVPCAKQLSASYQPISALMISQKIHDALVEASRKNGTFGHGFTYGGHPVACAVALETLKIYEERDMVNHVRSVSPTFLKELAALTDHPMVGDTRGVGLIGGIELMQDKAAKTPFAPAAKAGQAVQDGCERQGLIVRAIGDRIAVCPPLIVTDSDVTELFRRLRGGLDEAWAAVGKAQPLAAE